MYLEAAVYLSDFDYPLPEELIAQEPLADRSASRMLVVHRNESRWEDRLFTDLPAYLRLGDCLVLNNSRVFASRLRGLISGKARAAEVFLVRALSPDRRDWQALVKPGRQLRPGTTIEFPAGLSCRVLDVAERGLRIIRFQHPADVDAAIEHAGHVPLPPYIHREDRPKDRERYQTIYAKHTGSVAAPTAGLHFTPDVLASCRQAGASVAEVTLHVGLGTFQPLAEDRADRNQLHPEWFSIPSEHQQVIRSASRVVAVGTTSARTLETWALHGNPTGETDLFIYPGFEFRRVGAMLTNFHLPKSSLMLLVGAFAGRDLILQAYRHAVRSRYRFFSYGDCMLIL